MEILEETYEELRRGNLVSSHCEFSTTWLNKSRRYMSMIRSSRRDPSIDALARLAVNLKHYTDTCRESRYGELREKVDWLYPLTQKVWTAFYKQALGESVSANQPMP